MVINTTEENINQEFTLKNIDETKNYFVDETDESKLMIAKQKKFC